MRANIVIFTTGGTIDKVYFDAKSDYQVGSTIIGTLLEQAQVTHPYEVRELLQKDSLDLTTADRERIRNEVENCGSEKVIITHGTDTMTETATYLSDIEGKTIVLTGSLSPARFAMTDAMFNIGMAIAAVQALDQGVYIAMNGTVFNADNVVKDKAKNVFESKF